MKEIFDSERPPEDEDARDTWVPLEGDETGSKFKPEVQNAIRHLIFMARIAMKSGDRVDFYRDYRELLEQERRRSPEEKLHFFAHLSILLSGRQFVLNGERSKVVYCSESDLSKKAPILRACSVPLSEKENLSASGKGSGHRVHLIEVLAGMLIKE